MNLRIAFWNILLKDMRAYYMKPPIVSWGIIFPLAWAGMFFVRTGSGMDSILSVLPGVCAVSTLFGTTSLLAVAIFFEKRNRSFERLLLAPLPLPVLMLAKTVGAVFFGTVNAFIPIAMAAFFTDLSQVCWPLFLAAIALIAVASTYLALLVAVLAEEVTNAQAYSNFIRFPMLFLCGLFFPIAHLPFFLRPLSFLFPLTYGADLLHGAVQGAFLMAPAFDLAMLALFCAGLFIACLAGIKRKWIM